MSARQASVYTAFELQRETELGTPHIVVQEHLDLTQLGPVPLTSSGGERIVVQNTTLSIRVRRCPPSARIAPHPKLTCTVVDVTRNWGLCCARCECTRPPWQETELVCSCRATARPHPAQADKMWEPCCQDNASSPSIICLRGCLSMATCGCITFTCRL